MDPKAAQAKHCGLNTCNFFHVLGTNAELKCSCCCLVGYHEAKHPHACTKRHCACNVFDSIKNRICDSELGCTFKQKLGTQAVIYECICSDRATNHLVVHPHKCTLDGCPCLAFVSAVPARSDFICVIDPGCAFYLTDADRMCYCRDAAGRHDGDHPHRCNAPNCGCSFYQTVADQMRGITEQVQELAMRVPCAVPLDMKEGAAEFARAQIAIARECDAVKDMLLEKNRKYGNAALEPAAVFSRATPVERLLCRLDEKIARIKTMGADATVDEDTTFDLIGCLVLLRLAKAAEKEHGMVQAICGKPVLNDSKFPLGACRFPAGHGGDCNATGRRNGSGPLCDAICKEGDMCTYPRGHTGFCRVERKPSYNHTRGDGPDSPCSECVR